MSEEIKKTTTTLQQYWTSHTDITDSVNAYRFVSQTPFHSLLTESVDVLPVMLMDSKPLTVTRSDVNVDRAEIVVLLVAL